jgi:hypothetical protein
MLRTVLMKNSLNLKHPLSRWIPTNHPQRTWQNHTINKEEEHNKRENKEKNVQNNKLDEKIVNASTLDVIYHTETTNDINAVTWEIIDKNKVLTYHRESYQKLEYEGKERIELLAIKSVLKRINKAFKTYNTMPAPTNLTIWTNKTTTNRIIKESRYTAPTISNSIKDEAELILSIKEKLKKYEGYRVNTIVSCQNKDIKTAQKEMRDRYSDNNTLKPKNTENEMIAQLRINDKLITSNVATHVRNAMSDKRYIPYIKTKYNWNEDTVSCVDWEALKMATIRHSYNNHWIIPKLIHGWLPTRGHPGLTEYYAERTFCPRCKQNTETNDHFLACNSGRNQWVSQFAEEAHKKNNTRLHRVLVEAITTTMNQQPTSLPIDYSHISRSQQKIGWKQLLMGRMSIEWSHQYNKETDTEDGHKWVRNVILIVWKYIKIRWEERCEIAHEETPENLKEKNEAANSKLEEIYEKINEVGVEDRKMFKQSVEEMKTLPVGSKVSWIERTKRLIKIGIARQCNRHKAQHQRINTFFSTRIRRKTNKTQTDIGDSTELENMVLKTHTSETQNPLVLEGKPATRQSDYYPP